MKKNVIKISIIFSALALSFGLLVGIKSNNFDRVDAVTSSRAGVEAEWEEWTSTTSLPTNGHYYLGNNVTISSKNIRLESGDLYLDLNGFNIEFTYEGDSPDSAIYQKMDTNFCLYDSVGTGIIQKSNSANYERFIYIDGPRSIFEMNGGTIKNFKNSDTSCLGGAVYVEAATFTLNDGVISDCSAGEGGAIYAWLSDLNINGGTITNCSAYNVGGAIKVQDSDFNMTGGKICNNSTSGNGDLNQGGGIYAGVRIMAYVTGGEICNNTANNGDGGGIYVANMFNISGSLYIHDNLAKDGRGGGLFSGYGDESYGLVKIDGGFFGFNFCYVKDYDGFGKEQYAYLTVDSGRFSTKSTYTPSLVNEKSKITFDKKGGTGGTDTIESQTWATKLNKIDIPSKEGYSFLGYYDAYGQQYFDSKGNGTYKDESSNEWDYVGDQTLTAEWSINSYTVTLDSQGGTGGSTSVTATYGASMPSAFMPTKVGYSFLGYFDTVTGGNKYYNADGSSAKNWDKGTTATLYAHWEFIGVTTAMKLTFNYVNTPNDNNTFRLMCALDATDLVILGNEYNATEYGIYIEKEISGENVYAARFDFKNEKAYIGDVEAGHYDVYSETVTVDNVDKEYKYILIDLGDLVGEDKDNVSVSYIVHSYMKNGEAMDIGALRSSYSFASLLNYYLSLEEYKDNPALLQCKNDLGI